MSRTSRTLSVAVGLSQMRSAVRCYPSSIKPTAQLTRHHETRVWVSCCPYAFMSPLEKHKAWAYAATQDILYGPCPPNLFAELGILVVLRTRAHKILDGPQAVLVQQLHDVPQDGMPEILAKLAKEGWQQVARRTAGKHQKKSVELRMCSLRLYIVCVYIYIYMYMYMFLSTHTRACVYIYIYIYIYIERERDI